MNMVNNIIQIDQIPGNIVILLCVRMKGHTFRIGQFPMSYLSGTPLSIVCSWTPPTDHFGRRYACVNEQEVTLQGAWALTRDVKYDSRYE